MARRSPAERDFPAAVLLASDGSPDSWAAAHVAAKIARAHGSRVLVLHVPEGHDLERSTVVSEQVLAIEEEAGTEPAVIDGAQHVPTRIVDAAKADESSLIVMGHRGLHGIKALGSVSERVAHTAPCSVLLAPPRP